MFDLYIRVGVIIGVNLRVVTREQNFCSSNVLDFNKSDKF